MYFNRGSLPWQGLKANSKREKYDRKFPEFRISILHFWFLLIFFEHISKF